MTLKFGLSCPTLFTLAFSPFPFYISSVCNYFTTNYFSNILEFIDQKGSWILYFDQSLCFIYEEAEVLQYYTVGEEKYLFPPTLLVLNWVTVFKKDRFTREKHTYLFNVNVL